MLTQVRYLPTRLFFVSAVAVFTISLAVPESRASDGTESKENPAATASAAPVRKTFNVSYALYDGTLSVPPESESPLIPNKSAAAGTPAPSPRVPAVSTAPMTPGEKFKLFAQKSFLSPGPYLLSALSGVTGEWGDNDNHHHSKPGDFAADSGTRAARAFAFRATANFFEKFMFASMFRQDPRYHRSDKKGMGAKVGYAISRLFVTQGDRSGKDQFNISFLAGGLATSGMANLWEREERQDAKHFATRWTTHLALTALTNVLREFIGGQ